ncbi:unnamed protein product [Rotaria magnacalcarata]|uniref:AAA+ ATPase domain-containing protein n=1 Tax=Rotaria magnacalcarata TaxID=392030 RepID=A0A816XZ25_9BILA|nr:unnamed protein product [Rotaria magnacalcarata]
MKLTIYGKVERCLQRTEEIKNIVNYTVTTNETLIDNIPYCGSLINKKNREYDNDKGDLKHIMEYFNSRFYDVLIKTLLSHIATNSGITLDNIIGLTNTKTILFEAIKLHIKFPKLVEGAIVTDPNVTFEDVIGLDQAKEALKEAVILPVKFPQLFQGKRKPCSSILLYGPPGTGKSYLAKAIATECKSTFMSVSSSDLLSIWLGEAEKSIESVFELARERQPCILFIDEIDYLCGQRSDGESESSRRVKTEFLVQMQGVGTDNAGVLVLAATNIPWALDTAIRRRFEKRIYIPLPGVNERAAMFKTHLGTNTFHMIKEHEWMQLAQKSEHYSGADIGVVCREALLRPIRRLGSATHFKRVQNPKPDGPRELWLTCSPGDPYAQALTLDQIKSEELCEPPVTMSDMEGALVRIKPLINEVDMVKYRDFTETFGGNNP